MQQIDSLSGRVARWFDYGTGWRGFMRAVLCIEVLAALGLLGIAIWAQH